MVCFSAVLISVLCFHSLVESSHFEYDYGSAYSSRSDESAPPYVMGAPRSKGAPRKVSDSSHLQAQQLYAGPTNINKPKHVHILKQINRQNEDGSYTYGFEAADGTFKVETKTSNGEVYGKYGYIDDSGKVRMVEYGANEFGFQPVGDGITIPPPSLDDYDYVNLDDTVSSPITTVKSTKTARKKSSNLANEAPASGHHPQPIKVQKGQHKMEEATRISQEYVLRELNKRPAVPQQAVRPTEVTSQPDIGPENDKKFFGLFNQDTSTRNYMSLAALRSGHPKPQTFFIATLEENAQQMPKIADGKRQSSPALEHLLRQLAQANDVSIQHYDTQVE